MENRLEKLRKTLNSIINENEADKIAIYSAHMYGVSKFCSILAHKRKLDAELAATCGMLHDIGYMEVGGSSVNHGLSGSKRARAILAELKTYSYDEIETVAHAIENHSDKLNTHGAYDELLKDADVMDHCFYNTDFVVSANELERYNNLLLEFGIDCAQ